MSTWRHFLIAALSHRRFLPLCFGVYLGARALVVFTLPVEPTSDAEWYFERAVDIAEGRGYSERGVPTAYWPVGWPGLLGAMFSVFPAVPLVGACTNLALAAGSFWLLLELARVALSDELGARAGLMLLALYPNSIAYPSLLLGEVLSTFLVLLAAWIAVRGRGLAAAGLLGVVIGLAGLTRPQLLALLPMILALRVADRWHREEWARAAAFCAMAVLLTIVTLVPWAARNATRVGAPVLVSTNGGVNLLIGNNPQARGRFGTLGPERHVVAFSVADQVAADGRARSLALRWIRQHPAAFLALMPRKIFWLWGPDGESEWAYQAGYRGYNRHQRLFRAARVANQVYYLALLAGAALAVRGLADRLRRGGSPWMLLGLGMGLHATVVSAVFFGASRYHAVVMPFLAIHAGEWAARAIGDGLESSRTGDQGLARTPD